MQQEIRTFVAIKIQAEKETLNQLEDFKRLFKNDKIRWVSPENFHLTIRFIGNITREKLYELVDKLELIGEINRSFALKIKGAGYFKHSNKPRAVFLKICDSEELNVLVKQIERIVVECGFYEELKPFRPHLTLGRIKHLESRTKFYSVVDTLGDTNYQNVMVSEFVLYQSILKPSGPVYKPIKIFKLK